MNGRERVESRFLESGPPQSPLFMPNLTLWYAWHAGRDTLPAEWRGWPLHRIAEALGVPAWQTVRPFHVEHPGISIVRSESDTERSIRYETPQGSLTAHWAKGPDGDWWQTAHLIAAPTDLPAARALVEARAYRIDAEALCADAEIGSAGVLALELPRRPYSDLLHDFLGWSEGLMMLMGDERPALLELIDVLEQKLRTLTVQIAALPGRLVYAPDNLDGQYISPRVFQQSLAESYRQSAETLHATGKRLIVHAGGPIRRLLGPLAAAGLDGIEGVAGAPQSDASLAEARTATGPSPILWGGIAQDVLNPVYEPDKFEAAVREAGEQAADDPLAILGIADRVPVEADLGRLRAIPALLGLSAG